MRMSGELLINAIEKGDKRSIVFLLEKGANVNHENKDGYTALIYAAKIGRKECIPFLLEKGANVNHENKDGYTALIYAASNGQQECVALLLEKGANVYHENKDYETAKMIAEKKGHKECIALLLEYNVNNHDPNVDDNTALIKAAENGKMEIITLLLEKGTDACCQTKNGDTALIKTAGGGHKECIALLLDKGANINHKDKYGSTALMKAARYGHKECISLLLDKGADINHKAKYGSTSLIVAAKYDHKECISLLLGKGANINHQNEKGKTALLEAAENNSKECTTLLLENDADANILSNSDADGCAALTWVARYGNKENIELLLEKGADINHQTTHGWSALIQAALKGHEKCISLLLEKGADVDHLNKNGKSAMTYASQFSHSKCVRLLFSRGATLDKSIADDVIKSNPDFLFESPLPLGQCKSPATVLNKLHNTDAIADIMLNYLVNNDPKTLYHFIIYQHGLTLATSDNLFEEADLVERSSAMNNVIVEMFKCQSLDVVANLLQLLLPLLDFSGYDTKRFNDEFHENAYSYQIQNQQKRFITINSAHCIKYPEGKCVLHYCLVSGLKFIFQFSQISGIVDTIFYSTIAPSDNRIKRPIAGFYHRLFYLGDTSSESIDSIVTRFIMKPLNEAVENYTMFNSIDIVTKEKHFATMDMHKNGRYCPIYMFIIEATSKLVTIILVSYLCVNDETTDASMIASVALVLMIVGIIFYEIGQFQEDGVTYLSSWSMLDLVSLSLLILWMIFMTVPEYKSVSRVCLCVSSTPLCLGLLQSFSINKAFGQLIIMIIAMSSDILSFFSVYVICTFGFTVTMTGLSQIISNSQDDDIGTYTGYSSVVNSFLLLYSGTLGGFSLADVNSSQIDNLATFLLAIYLLASSVLLLNLLIARMSNTHQRISDAAMQEWSFFVAQTVKQHVLVKEKSPLCMLPPPLNLITTAVAPLHYPLMRQGVSVAGSIADKLLVFPGQIQSYFFLLYLYARNLHKLIRDIVRRKSYSELSLGL